MDKNIELEKKYFEAVGAFSKALTRLKMACEEEIGIAQRFADDSHMPHDALVRLEKVLTRTKELEEEVKKARSELINNLF